MMTLPMVRQTLLAKSRMNPVTIRKDSGSDKIKNNTRLGCVAVSLFFVVYSALYISRSSFVLSDGKRYFCLQDDAMISMRYAWNWSHGHGLVWNVGERVEGYTNPLMVALMSGVTHFFNKRISCLVVQMLGVGILLGCAFLCSRVVMQLLEDDEKRKPGKYQSSQGLFRSLSIILGFSVPLLYYPFIYWGLMGMETSLLTLILLGIVYACFKWSECLGVRQALVIAVLSGLAYLTRPDAVIPLGILFVFLFVRLLRAAAPARAVSSMLVVVPVLGAVVVAHIIFRYLYYGQLLPNTYILKATGMSRLQFLQNGWAFVRYFFDGPSSGLFILSLLACIFSFSAKRLTLLGVFISLIIYQIYIGGEPFRHYRPFCPGVVLLLPVAIVEIRRLLLLGYKSKFYQKRFISRSMSPGRHALAALMVALYLLVVIGLNWRYMSEIRTVRPFRADYFHPRNCETAVLLSSLTRPEASIGVFWAGAIPYYTGLHSVDFLGKCDEVISRLPADTSGSLARWTPGVFSAPGHNKYDLNYSIKELMPDYVQGFDWGRQDLRKWAINRYVGVPNGRVVLFLKKDSPNVLWHKIKFGALPPKSGPG